MTSWAKYMWVHSMAEIWIIFIYNMNSNFHKFLLYLICTMAYVIWSYLFWYLVSIEFNLNINIQLSILTLQFRNMITCACVVVEIFNDFNINPFIIWDEEWSPFLVNHLIWFKFLTSQNNTLYYLNMVIHMRILFVYSPLNFIAI